MEAKDQLGVLYPLAMSHRLENIKRYNRRVRIRMQ